MTPEQKANFDAAMEGHIDFINSLYQRERRKIACECGVSLSKLALKEQDVRPRLRATLAAMGFAAAPQAAPVRLRLVSVDGQRVADPPKRARTKRA